MAHLGTPVLSAAIVWSPPLQLRATHSPQTLGGLSRCGLSGGNSSACSMPCVLSHAMQPAYSPRGQHPSRRAAKVILVVQISHTRGSCGPHVQMQLPCCSWQARTATASAGTGHLEQSQILDRIQTRPADGSTAMQPKPTAHSGTTMPGLQLCAPEHTAATALLATAG